MDYNAAAREGHVGFEGERPFSKTFLAKVRVRLGAI